MNWMMSFIASFVVGGASAYFAIKLNRGPVALLVITLALWTLIVLPIIIWVPR